MKYKQFIKEQRYQIQVLLQENVSKTRIAELVGVYVSTIYREIKRNTGKRVYNAERAQSLCDLRKERFGRNRRFNTGMKRFMEEKKSKEEWSPEQIVGHCKLQEIPMVSQRVHLSVYT